MLNTEQLLYQSDKSSQQRCSIKKAVLKYSEENTVLESLLQL